MAYKLEDQKNINRRNNLIIRCLPEPTQGEDLMRKMQIIFNPVQGREETELIKIERVHRIRRPKGISMETPRNKIGRFLDFREKNLIWGNLRGKPPLEYKTFKFQIFADLSQETLNRKRQLKPLLEQLQNQDVRYNWGFPACPIGRKDGRMAKLKYPEEMQDFCKSLEIPTPDITR